MKCEECREEIESCDSCAEKFVLENNIICIEEQSHICEDCEIESIHESKVVV